MWFFWIGLVIGILLTLPVASIAARRAAYRVRQLEQRARTAERLAELGTLTGGLAHEIKNPLSTIGLNVQLLQEDLAELTQDAVPGELPEDRMGRLMRRLDTLGRETQRLRDILEDFLRFAGRIKLERSPTSINVLVGELTDFFEPQAQEAAVRLRTTLTVTPTIAHADASQLKQALLNLLINACQAMKGARQGNKKHGGADELIIRTERKRVLGQEEILIHVIDTGPGMDDRLQEKIFAPYYSTRQSGSGLGLAVARRIVEEHGGNLTAHSELGRGTDFTIALPVSPLEKPSF